MPDREIETHHSLDVEDILGELYVRKFLILGLTLFAGVATAGITMMWPNIYESSAAIIVREPDVPTGTQSSSTLASLQSQTALSVETLQTLAESTAIKWNLFNRLWEKDLLEFPVDASDSEKSEHFVNFRNSVTTELRSQQTRGSGGALGLLPILVLKTYATKPEHAQIIAKEWTDLLVEKSREIYTEGVNALDEFIGSIYEQSNEALDTLETARSDKVIDGSLELKREQMENLLRRNGMLEREIMELRATLAVNARAIEQGRQRIADQQVDGEWIGTVAETQFAEGELTIDPGKLPPVVREIVNHVERFMAQSVALRDFQRESGLRTKQQRFRHHQIELDRVLTEKALAETKLPSLRAELAELQIQLESIPQKIVVKKAITDDALWQSRLSTRDDGELAGALTEEVVNPLHQSVKRLVVNASADIQSKESAVEALTASAATLMKSIGELESEIDAIERTVERRENELKSSQEVLRLLRQDYTTELNDLITLQSKQNRLGEEKDAKERVQQELEDELHRLEHETVTFEREIGALERLTEDTKSVRNMLASQANEVALLQVHAEQASRTGTVILYNAQADPQKVAPSRMKIVLAVMIVALLLFSSAVVAARALRETVEH